MKAVYYRMNTIGSRLKSYAKARCGSIKRLAEELEMRPDNLQKYASGRNEPGSKLLQQLAAHGCNVHWLLTGDGTMNIEEMGSDGFSKEMQEMFVMLHSAGIKDPTALRSLFADLQVLLATQESLTRLAGKSLKAGSDLQKKGGD